jgi:nucleotide-binding universal stress UspA family protein
VVVGVDGLPASLGALDFAANEAVARGVELVALYAWWMLPPGGDGQLTPPHYDLAAAEQEAYRLLSEATAACREQNPDLQVTLRPVHAANPIVALLDAAQGAGLLVVSRHGGNALTRLLFTSIGDVAVREAPCPVAVVPETAG